MTKQSNNPGMTMSPKPSMEKWPAIWLDGNTSFPGNDSLGAFFAMLCVKWNLLAMALMGLVAGLVATRTMTLALNTYLEKNTQNTS